MRRRRLYRKKPVIIEALLLDMDEDFDEAAAWTGLPVRYCDEVDAVCLDIPTLEGTMTAHFGDYLVRGVAGEFYPVREDIFKAAYEAV